MSEPKILLELQDGVAIVRMNDPAVLNAMSFEMLAELDQAIDKVVRSARAMILTGTGKGFCSGANLMGEPLIGEDGQPDIGLILEKSVNPLMSKLRHLPIPWISAVRGAAAGAGSALALAADLIIAGESAFFLQAFCRVGLVPDAGSPYLLARAIGRARAMELMLLGERLPAAKALEWGLINRVVPDEQLESAALQIASSLAHGPTKSLAMIRDLAWAALDAEWEESLALERRMQRDASRTADHQEGVAAFREKRAARFNGK